MKYDIFISYSRRNLDIVRAFYDRLCAEGFNVWIDMKGLYSGDQFKREITKAIIGSRVLVFFSSEQSNRSIWTASEIGVAREFKIPILPVRIDDTPYSEEVLLDLVNLNYTDYTVESERPRRLNEFIESLKRNYPPSGQPAGEAGLPPPAKVRTEPVRRADPGVLQALTDEFKDAYLPVCNRYPIFPRTIRRSEDVAAAVSDICRCVAVDIPTEFLKMSLADQVGLLEAYDRDDQVRLALAIFLELVQESGIR